MLSNNNNENNISDFPDKNSIKKYENQIYDMFPDDQHDLMDPLFVRDFAAMAACLSPEIVFKHLKKLSDEVEGKLREQELIEDSNDTKITIKKKPGKDYASSYKILSSLLDKWAYENGFNPGVDVHCLIKDKKDVLRRELISLPSSTPILLQNVDPKNFRGVLQSLGYIFKDIGASVMHGDLSHMLAIYIIVEENKIRKFLQQNPLDLYKKTGTFPYINYDTDTSVWDVIFDSMNNNSLNTPEVLNDAMRGANINYAVNINDNSQMLQQHTKILSAIMSGRYNKRLAQTPNEDAMESPQAAFIKYNQMPGIVIDNSILFKTNENKRLLVFFDEVGNESSYDPNLKAVPPPIRISQTSDLFGRIYSIFDKKNATNIECEGVCKRIQAYLSSNKHGSSHRELTIYLSDYFLNYQNERVRFLINCAQGQLLEYDKTDILKQQMHKKKKIRI